MNRPDRLPQPVICRTRAGHPRHEQTRMRPYRRAGRSAAQVQIPGHETIFLHGREIRMAKRPIAASAGFIRVPSRNSRRRMTGARPKSIRRFCRIAREGPLQIPEFARISLFDDLVSLKIPFPDKRKTGQIETPDPARMSARPPQIGRTTREAPAMPVTGPMPVLARAPGHPDDKPAARSIRVPRRNAGRIRKRRTAPPSETGSANPLPISPETP